MSEQERAFLAKLGLNGWNITGRRAAMKTEKGTDDRGNAFSRDVALPLTYVWSVSDGKGNFREMTVRGNSGDEGRTFDSYEMLEAPKDVPASQQSGGPVQDANNNLASEMDRERKWNQANGGLYETHADRREREAKEAKEGKPVEEGAKRKNVVEGYEVQQVYRGGQWIVDPSVPPKKWMPEEAKPKRTQVVATPDGTWLIDLDTGQKIEKVGDATAPTEVQKFSDGVWLINTQTGQKISKLDGAAQPQLVQGADGQWMQWDSTGNDGKGGWIPAPGMGAAPAQVVQAPADQATLVQRDPQTGALTTMENPAYMPKDGRERIALLQSRATKERDRLAGLVQDGKLTQQQAKEQFQKYWAGAVEPGVTSARASIEEEVRKAQEERAVAGMNYEKDRAQTGLDAGQKAVENERAKMPYMVGPTFAGDFANALKTISSGGGEVNFDPAGFTFQMPDFEKVAQQASDRAMSTVKPFADAMSGINLPGGVPAGFDLNSLLSTIPVGAGPGASQQPAPGPNPYAKPIASATARGFGAGARTPVYSQEVLGAASTLGIPPQQYQSWLDGQ